MGCEAGHGAGRLGGGRAAASGKRRLPAGAGARPRTAGQRAGGTMARSARLLRAKDDAAAGRVAFVELFYDLVFVFAITQLSHLLLHHYTPLGALETGLLLLAVWWVWIYTTWAMNWLDPPARPGAGDDLRLDAARALHVDVGARGLRRARARLRPVLRGDAGRPQPLHRLVLRRPGVAAAELPAHRRPGWRPPASSGSPAGWRTGEARLALWIVALGIEYLGPWARLLDAGARRRPRRRTGTCGASISPSAAGSSSSSASARRC